MTSNKNILGKLANPIFFQEDLKNEDKFSNETLQKFYSQMFRIREAEKIIALGKKEGKIGGPVHLGIGQEAIAVGVSHSLKTTDKVFSGHRSHAHLLALGSDSRKLFAEILGKSTGLSKGMGGSMHLIDKEVGFLGSVPIVAGTVPLAVGAALASKLRKDKSVAIAYLGDGAIEEGVVHESLNLAKVLSCPIIFVMENNLFSSHMHISLRQPSDLTARYAEANNIYHETIDGNDVIQVALSIKNAVHNAREDMSPAFIECVTYRWLGHVDWREDIDVGVSRSKTEIREWKKRDPINRLERTLIKKHILNSNQIKLLNESIIDDIQKDWDKAMKDLSQKNNFFKNLI